MVLFMRRSFQFFVLFLLVLSMLGCSALSGLFGSRGGVDLSAPKELQEFTPTFSVEENWSRDIGDGSEEVFPISIPEIVDNVIYVADRKGDIHAIDQDTGRVNWSVDSKQTITGAVGVGGDLVLIGTDTGQVHAFDRANGEFKWKVQLASQVLSAPATNGEQVVAVTQDGKIYGLNGEDGSQIWLADVNLPLLTLYGNSTPIVFDDIAFMGLDNGKAAAFRLADGARLWEVRVGIPEGKNDLERMVDIDGQLLYHNGNLYAASFQSGVMAINPQAGRGLWFQEGSIQNSPGAWGGTLVVTQDDGVVKAFNANDGTELWTSEEFKFRNLNSPALTSDYVAFADFEGYLHLLSRRTGKLIGRERVARDGVRTPTIIDGDKIYILSNTGKLSSHTISEI